MALSFVSRPVCTLEQYIDFYGTAGRGSGDQDPVGRGRGIRAGSRVEHGIPRYYDLIRQFVGGPGGEPGSRISELPQGGPDNPDKASLELTVYNDESALETFTTLSPGQKASYGDLPDSRKDWQRALVAYLKTMFDPSNAGDGKFEVVPPQE